MKMRSQVLSITISDTIPDRGVWIARDGWGQIVARISGGSITAVRAWAAAYDKHQWVKFILQDSPSFPFPQSGSIPKREDWSVDSDVGYTFGGGRG